VRGAIARDLCAYGFEPALGIHHHNELNAFNLADDLIDVCGKINVHTIAAQKYTTPQAA
jgi:CRISPR/Cas system-associated endonuclease Cas1